MAGVKDCGDREVVTVAAVVAVVAGAAGAAVVAVVAVVANRHGVDKPSNVVHLAAHVRGLANE